MILPNRIKRTFGTRAVNKLESAVTLSMERSCNLRISRTYFISQVTIDIQFFLCYKSERHISYMAKQQIDWQVWQFH